MAKVIIKKVSKGKFKGQYRFILKADNGENLSPNENYHNHSDLVETVSTYFPHFEVVDNTKKLENNNLENS